MLTYDDCNTRKDVEDMHDIPSEDEEVEQEGEEAGEEGEEDEQPIGGGRGQRRVVGEDVGDPTPPPGVSDDVTGGSDAVAAPADAVAAPAAADALASALPVRVWATRTGGGPQHPVSENGRRRVVGDGDEHMSAMEVAATVAADLLVAEVGTDSFNAAHSAVEALGLPHVPPPA